MQVGKADKAGKEETEKKCEYAHCPNGGTFKPSRKNRTRNVQRFCSRVCRVAQWEFEKFGKVRSWAK